MTGGPAALVLVRRKPPATPAAAAMAVLPPIVRPRARASVPLRTARAISTWITVGSTARSTSNPRGIPTNDATNRMPTVRQTTACRSLQTTAVADSMARMLTMMTVSSGSMKRTRRGARTRAKPNPATFCGRAATAPRMLMRARSRGLMRWR